jgi:hypothetical protein
VGAGHGPALTAITRSLLPAARAPRPGHAARTPPRCLLAGQSAGQPTSPPATIARGANGTHSRAAPTAAPHWGQLSPCRHGVCDPFHSGQAPGGEEYGWTPRGWPPSEFPTGRRVPLARRPAPRGAPVNQAGPWRAHAIPPPPSGKCQPVTAGLAAAGWPGLTGSPGRDPLGRTRSPRARAESGLRIRRPSLPPWLGAVLSLEPGPSQRGHARQAGCYGAVTVEASLWWSQLRNGTRAPATPECSALRCEGPAGALAEPASHPTRPAHPARRPAADPRPGRRPRLAHGRSNPARSWARHEARTAHAGRGGPGPLAHQ